jgi:HlyD family secretion protein
MWNMLKKIIAKKSIRYGAIAAVVAVVVILIYRRPPVVIEIHKIQKGTFEAFVEEDGITRVRENYKIFSPASGVMMRITKHAGDHIAKGEILTHVMLDYFRPIRSPLTGTILKIYRESEGPIEMGAPIADIGDTSKLEIVSDVLTRDVVQLKPGNQVVISGWGGKQLTGQIRLIEPAAFTKVSTLGVEEQRVHVIMDVHQPQELGEGFQVRCHMIAYRRENSLTVPVSGLFRDGESWATYKVIKSRARKSLLKVIDIKGGVALIQEGVSPGDEVILFPGETIRDGVRVR